MDSNKQAVETPDPQKNLQASEADQAVGMVAQTPANFADGG